MIGGKLVLITNRKSYINYHYLFEADTVIPMCIAFKKVCTID